MEEIMQLVLEIVLAYTRSEKHHYDALFEIYELLLQVEYMFNFEIN